MNKVTNIFKLPTNYFKLPFSDDKINKQYKPIELIFNFILLALFALFAFSFKVLTEYGFDKLLLILSVSVPIYYLLTPKYRIPFLILIFIAFLAYAIGYLSALFYIVSALFILFVLRNPKNYLLLFGLAILITGIILLRVEILYFPRLIIASHYLAAAFMFRGIRFYYESKHGLLKTGFWLDLVYFFIPANLCFSFFPIIDPLKLANSYVGFKAVKSGLKRISYGFFLVLLYRVFTNVFPISFEDVNNFSSLLHYSISKYSLVLNIAGIILAGAGTINLFGFELPTLFGNFLLATSFSELWRKINTYWSDFLLRVFYYPLYFKFKKLPEVIKIYLSINIAFFITWFLHEYQLFWISGTFSIKATSLLYWMIFGNLVAYTIHKEFKFHKAKKTNIFINALIASGIFLTCSFMWLFWESETIGEFAYLVKASFVSSEFTFTNLIFTLLCLYIVYVLCLYLEKMHALLSEKLEYFAQFVFLPLLFLFFIYSTSTSFEKSFPELKQKLVAFSGSSISEEDNFARDESYYENVLNLSKNKSNPWEIQLKGEKKWGTSNGATRRTGDILMREFVPNSETNLGYFTLKINSDGFRDDEYSQTKDTNCFRIALVGSSNECGYGVDKNFVFETIAESKLDSIYNLKGKKIEILNFASLGSMLIQNIEIVKRKVLKYKPNVLIYFSHPKEDKHIARNLSKLIQNGVDLKYNILKEAKASAGVSQNHSRQQIVKRLLPYSRGIMEWGYSELANDCIKNGIKPVWAFIPTPKDDLPRLNYQKFSDMASKRNFIILDFSTVYKGYDLKQIQASETDLHPGKLGHQLISKMFIEKLLENGKEIGLD